MSLGAPQILLIILLVILLFGRGRISSLMGELARGIKSFQSGLREDPKDKLDDDRSSDKADVIDVNKSEDNTNS
ncbi:MAG: twin-arginine translocase TatA/TatE family subunit [Pseudomonadota bacterium]|nr:twin-arginine translocase TatA/TatE family subunit [Pseudomonadota bacterium]MEC8768428.1 twin-arginine translocase TatA/TatE family subunit [Pseudomonadota bacterium]